MTTWETLPSPPLQSLKCVWNIPRGQIVLITWGPETAGDLCFALLKQERHFSSSYRVIDGKSSENRVPRSQSQLLRVFQSCSCSGIHAVSTMVILYQKCCFFFEDKRNFILESVKLSGHAYLLSANLCSMLLRRSNSFNDNFLVVTV